MIADLERLLRALAAIEGVTSAAGTVNTFVDAARVEGVDYWNGRVIVAVTGAVAGQASIIVDDDGAGTLTVRPALSAAPGTNQVYLILNQFGDAIPSAADLAENYLPSQVIGRKDDTALYAVAATASLMRYLKGLITAGIAVPGTVSDAGPAITDFDTDLTEATDDHYNGMLLMFIEGPNAGQAHTIDNYTGGTKNVSFKAGDQWTDVPVNGNAFVILPSTGNLLQAFGAELEQLLAWDTAQSGTLLATGGVDQILLTAETYDFELYLDIDLSNMAGGDTTVLSVNKRVDGATLRLADQQTFVNAQTILVYSIGPVWGNADNDIQVTLQQTAGVMRNYPWRWNIKRRVTG